VLDHSNRAIGSSWLVGAAVWLYLVMPGHAGAGLAGLPLDVSSTVVLCACIGALWWLGPRRLESRVTIAFAVVAAVVIGGKCVVGATAPAEGWQAQYFANETYDPPARRSTDFLTLDATRVDRQLAFRDDLFPVFFFNENTFNRGVRREVEMPFSVRWTGSWAASETGTFRLQLAARGSAAVAADGSRVLEVNSGAESSAATALVTLGPGTRLEVTYAKPANADGLLAVHVDLGRGFVPWGAPLVVPTSVQFRSASLSSTRLAAGFGVHAVAAGLLLVALVALARAPRRDVSRWTLERALYGAILGLAAVQGLWKARALDGRFLSLSSGDDWLQYEAAAREILIGGPLMTYGKPIGAGDPYFYYPFYSYFVALTHRIWGEGLFGVIFAQFLVLGAATVVTHRLATWLFGRQVALVATGLLVVVQQIAFVRHYTTTLLAENLFFLLAVIAVASLTAFVLQGRLRWLMASGLAGGLAAITKPSIMLMLPVAVLIVTIVAARKQARSWPSSAVCGLAFAGAWMSIVAATALRNFVVSGDPVLITSGQQWSFVLHNLPSSELREEYIGRLANAGGGYLGTLELLLRLLWTHPTEFLSGIFVKVMFSLGMVQWLGGRVHPELLLLSTGYLTSLVTFRAARAPATWPAHAFVATHLVTMTLTNPSIYGYRLILPMYLFFAPFAGLACWRVFSRVAPRIGSASISRRWAH
jgi:hypothetical protein